MDLNEKAFNRGKNMVARVFPGLLPIVVTVDYSVQDETFIGVNRTGRVLLPRDYATKSDEFLATAMAFSALYCYGFNLFNGESSRFSAEELLSAVEKNPYAMELNSPEVRYLKLDGRLTYALKKRATVAALRFDSSRFSSNELGRILQLLAEEKALKTVLQEELYAFQEERFRLSRLTLEDRVNVLWDIQDNQLSSQSDYKVTMSFLERNLEEIHEAGLITYFISSIVKAARTISLAEVDKARKQLIEPILEITKRFDYKN